MGESKLKVLEMLKEGSITTEDALKLLKSLDEDDYANTNDRTRNNDNPHGGHHQRQYQNNKNIDMSWITDLKDTIVESIKATSSQMENGYSPFGFSTPNKTFTCTSTGTVNEINSLKLIGKNDKIEVTESTDGLIHIDAVYKAKSDMDPHILFEETGGNYSLLYDTNAVHAIGLRVQIPAVKVNNLHVETKNAEIFLKNMVAETADFINKNAGIQVENFESVYANFETKNAALYLINVKANELEIKTTNAKIELQDVFSGSARLQTTNANIIVDRVDIRYIYAKSSNGSIRFFNIADVTNTQYPLYSIEVYTSNSGISLDLPHGTAVATKLNASTTSGNIKTGLQNLNYLTDEKNYVDAKSQNYDDALQKLEIICQTSNGNIKINA